MTSLPELLVIGHVTRDLFPGENRLGGAASFSTRAAAMLGIQTALVTAAPPDFSLLAPLKGLSNVSLHIVPSQTVTTFEVDYSGPRRRLYLREVARPIRIEDIPVAWRGIPVAYVAPVAGECDRALVDGLSAKLICAGFQGWLRRSGADQRVEPAITPEALEPPRGLNAIVFSEEDHPEGEFMAEQLAQKELLVALTRGRKGSTLRKGSQRWDISAAPAHEVDPTGAGDVFGIALTLALARGASPQEAARVASEIAARVVEGPELGKLTAADAAHLPPRARTP
ncbi:PfkB family carbohydrate kinase [Stigmatella aurantiaca]|uniref:Carbohydrate kinase, PfkB family n=1 Tax=Stigmatella aurantiaca (strain DW4/3-1) TaxID=378806 RepID=Q08S13_STIAD|nr:PfkB family carbohydrate kinase [Stigmatella aurantiaca]ADO72681.1 Carbohydrate kinase, PfkB family [Stigmatella aurantiaca DW4/3-1]EAU63262.1 carbohydrate kinase, PfkB family [Stigmatella aurantiaca DW4/3-1]